MAPAGVGGTAVTMGGASQGRGASAAWTGGAGTVSFGTGLVGASAGSPASAGTTGPAASGVGPPGGQGGACARTAAPGGEACKAGSVMPVREPISKERPQGGAVGAAEAAGGDVSSDFSAGQSLAPGPRSAQRNASSHISKLVRSLPSVPEQTRRGNSAARGRAARDPRPAPIPQRRSASDTACNPSSQRSPERMRACTPPASPRSVRRAFRPCIADAVLHLSQRIMTAKAPDGTTFRPSCMHVAIAYYISREQSKAKSMNPPPGANQP